jgi:type IV secretory pathway ATPase VirB11/archaellum biosynthesis ATPase
MPSYPCYRGDNSINDMNTNAGLTVLCDVDDVKIKDPTGIYATRRDLDQKMKELYQFRGTKVDDAKRHYSATMVAGTVWSCLALSLIYYTYTRT